MANISRKDFLTTASVALLGVRCDFDTIQQLEAKTAAIPERVLGKTGVKLPMIGIGGYHLGGMYNEKAAIAIARLAVDLGIKFIDTAHCYQGGDSEKLLGRALKGVREKTFLMTKVHERDAKGAMKELEASLRALNTDHVDLWQFHNVMYHSEVKKIFSENGALQAALKAQKQGKIRFIGLTGHYNPKVQAAALKYHRYLDTLQVPVNLVDGSQPHGYVQSVLPIAAKHNVSVLAMKTLVKGKLVSRNIVSAKDAMHYSYSQQGVDMLVSGINRKKYIYENIRIAADFKPMSLKRQQKLLRHTDKKTSSSLEHYRRG